MEGAANLAETDELIGAEPYILQNVKDLDYGPAVSGYAWTALQRTWPPGTAPQPRATPPAATNSGDIYNIVLKSIGAAHEAPSGRSAWTTSSPTPRPMRAPGYSFYGQPRQRPGKRCRDRSPPDATWSSSSPATAPSPTSPLCPPSKSSPPPNRYDLLPGEMDVNAGAYLDGAPHWTTLGRQMTGPHPGRGLRRPTSSKGERAGTRPGLPLEKLAADRHPTTSERLLEPSPGRRGRPHPHPDRPSAQDALTWRIPRHPHPQRASHNRPGSASSCPPASARARSPGWAPNASTQKGPGS